MTGACLSTRLICLAKQEEQDWLQLMKETENTAEEASPGAAAGEYANGPVTASVGRHLAPAASAVL